MTDRALSLHELFVDRIVRHVLARQGIEVEEGWMDENDNLVWDRFPPHLQGPVAQMRENAIPLADALIGAIFPPIHPRAGE